MWGEENVWDRLHAAKGADEDSKDSLQDKECLRVNGPESYLILSPSLPQTSLRKHIAQSEENAETFPLRVGKLSESAETRARAVRGQTANAQASPSP